MSILVEGEKRREERRRGGLDRGHNGTTKREGGEGGVKLNPEGSINPGRGSKSVP